MASSRSLIADTRRAFTPAKSKAAAGDGFSTKWVRRIAIAFGVPFMLMFIWTGDGTRSAAFVAGAWTIILITWFVIWRRKWINSLAAAGIRTPNVFRLIVQVAQAKRRAHLAVTRFELAAINQPKLQSSAKSGRKTPKPTRVRITADLNVEAFIDMSSIGRTVTDLAECADAIAQVSKAEQFVVRRRTAGTAHVIWQYTDPLHTILQFRDLPLPAQVKPGEPPRWVGGVDEDGDPMEVSIDKPVMVGGEQGSGKSVFAWDLIGSLHQQGLWVKVYGIDPKGGMEQGQLGDHVGEWLGRMQVAAFYAGDDVKAGTKIIEQAYNQIDMRAKRLATEKVRRFLPGSSKEDPIILLMIDEALDYSELWKKSDSILNRYMRKARAVGGTAIAVFQFGHASDLGVGQKVFGARFCFRAAKETGDTILGTGAYERGARVNDIPRSQPGIGYYVDDEGRMKRFRAAHATDDVVDLIAAGGVPHDMGTGGRGEPEREVACYRLFDEDSVSLYVGQSVSPADRFEQHAAEKPWWDQVDWSKVRITWHPASEINKVEAREIARLLPRYNDKLNRRNPFRVDWRAQQLDPAPDDEVLDGEVLSEETTFEPADAR